MNNPKIVIPFWEVIKRSFNYVFLNFSSVSRLIAVPFLVMAGGQMLFKSQGMLLQLVLLLLTAFVGVSWSRLVILNEQPRFSKVLVGCIFRYLLNYLGIALLLLCPGILVLMGMYVFGDAAQQEQFALLAAGKGSLEGSARILIWPLVTVIVSSLICARLRLSLAAAAVEDREIGLINAFRISRGNTWRIYGGLIIIGLPVQILYVLVVQMVVVMPQGNQFFSAVGIIAGAALSLVDICLKASFDAHAYQYFTYFYHKRTEDEEAMAARTLVEEEIKHRRD